MKKILGFALGITMIALTPAVENAQTLTKKQIIVLARMMATVERCIDESVDNFTDTELDLINKKIDILSLVNKKKFLRTKGAIKTYEEFKNMELKGFERKLICGGTVLWMNGMLMGAL